MLPREESQRLRVILQQKMSEVHSGACHAKETECGTETEPLSLTREDR